MIFIFVIGMDTVFVKLLPMASSQHMQEEVEYPPMDKLTDILMANCVQKHALTVLVALLMMKKHKRSI